MRSLKDPQVIYEVMPPDEIKNQLGRLENPNPSDLCQAIMLLCDRVHLLEYNVCKLKRKP